jgi:hypothetical protein
MSKWIAEGKIKWKENIFEGLENAPKAFGKEKQEQETREITTVNQVF